MENINKQQRELLEKLQVHDPALEVHWDEARGVASSIRGSLGNYANEVKEGRLDAFLQEYGPLFGPPELPEGLRLLQHMGDELGWDHLVFQHWVVYHDELEVYGAKLAAHADPEGELIEVQSSLWRDLKVDAEPRFDSDELHEILAKRIRELDGFDRLRKRQEEPGKEFSLFDEPRMVVYPWQGDFRLAWITYGYSEFDERGGRPVDRPYIAYGRIFVDATTGERFLFAPTLKSAETATAGTGLAVTPLNGPYTTRNLNVVRVDTSPTYRLKDTAHNRHIVTYDADCNAAYSETDDIAAALRGGTLPISEDTDGNHRWDRLPTGIAQRKSGQQPEVDDHHHVRLQYEWYDTISGGRDGWDDNKYLDPPVPPQTLHVIAHWRDSWEGCQGNNGYENLVKKDGTWVTWLAFLDGDASIYDYPAGCHWLVAHEYQHAITDFSFKDSGGDPGLTYADWLAAVHEGLSDTFAGLSTEQWLPCKDISHSSPPRVYRNLVFPRDTTAYDPDKLDHFDDRNILTDPYERGAILAHCAYLMGKGGVHQRGIRDPEGNLIRKPEYIPVLGLGRQNWGGMNVPKAARIWYRALTYYFSTHGELTGIPANDESAFRTLRNGCVSAAADIYGGGSAEHRNTILAFYAVGLHSTTYGADPTFLRWGVSWDLSRLYVGLTSPNYSSLDLFINNGGASEWNALINITDPNTGLPTEYENTIYCRVRNVGDQQANNVVVQFHYAKAGTGTMNWLPVEDKSGVAQTLTIGTLGAGQSNFPDSAQNSPPASASVKWCIPPLAPGEVVDHFCLRARVTSSNDVNTHNNEVQSNIVYTAYSNPTAASLTFVAGNPFHEFEIPLDFRLDAKLPERWSASIKGVEQRTPIGPREELPFELIIEMASGDDERMELPLDGDLFGEVRGDVVGEFTGSLTDTLLSEDGLVGQVSGLVHKIGTISGSFEGEIDRLSGELKGYIIGSLSTEPGAQLKLEFHGCLRPWRRVDVSQWHDGEIIGGVTVQVQVPREQEPCGYEMPPTDTRVKV